MDGSVAWKGGRWGGGEGGRAEVGWESDSRGRTHTRNLEEGASKERLYGEITIDVAEFTHRKLRWRIFKI